jgi:hypothetical protein
MNAPAATLEAPKPKPIPVLGRRFTEADINTYGQWLIDRLLKAFPHRNQRDMIGWLKDICWSNEYFFRCRPNAVALAHLQKAHPLAAKPQVKVIFVFAKKGNENEGLAFFTEIAEWAMSMDVEEVTSLTDLSDIPSTMIDEVLKTRTKTVVYAKV